MGLSDLTQEEEEENEQPIPGVPKQETEEKLETFRLPLSVMVEIEAPNFAQAVKELREKHEPGLSGLLFKRRPYMEPEIPEDINRYRDD